MIHTACGALRRKAVHLERAQQTDRRVRNPLGDLRQRVQLHCRGVRESVEPATHVLEQVSVGQSFEVGARDGRGLQVAGTHRTASREPQELICLGGRHDTKLCILYLYINVS